MGKKEFLKFGDIEIKKREFHSSKSSIPIGDVNNGKMVISDTFSGIKNGSKSFVGYQNSRDISP